MKKALNIIKTVLVCLLVVAAVGMMIFTIVSVTTFDRTDRNLFGYKAMIVRSDSMSATDFSAGDLIISKVVDPSTLKEGDIISFISRNEESYGETVTHKIRSLVTDENGDPGFVTYGTTTDTDDSTVVTYMYVIGQYQFRLKGVGTFFSFLKTTVGYITCILLPFLLLIGLEGVKTIRLFRQYKKEQEEALQAERDAIAAEREESLRLMRELQAMKEQQQTAAPPVAAAAPAAAPAEDELQAEREKIAAEREENMRLMQELREMQAKLAAQTAQQTGTPKPASGEENTAG